MPRLYREAPLASIWEGSGNVAALDALRALTLQGALLVRYGHPAVADAFAASRLSDDAAWGRAYGTLASGLDTAAIVSHATPELLS